MPEKSLIPQELNVNDVAQILRDLMSELVKSGRRYAPLAQEIGVTTASLKQFVNRPSFSYQTGNRTLNKIYQFVMENRSNIENIVSNNLFRKLTLLDEEYMEANFANVESEEGVEFRLYEDMVTHSYHLIYKMFRLSVENLKPVFQRISGSYLCFRGSSIYGRIVVTKMLIEEKTQDSGVWEFIHDKRDRFNEEMKIDGVVLPIHTNIYLIGDIEYGSGIEFIVFKEPIAKNFEFLVGFTITMGYDRRIVSTRILCKRLEDDDMMETGVYNKEKIPNKYKSIIDSYLYDESDKYKAKTIDDIS